MQAVRPFSEWPSLMNRAAGNRDPISESAGVEIKELTEEVLIHIQGREGVTANGVLNTRRESDRIISHVQYGIDPNVEDGVVGVAILNQQTAGKRDLSSSIPFSNQTSNCGPAV